MIGSLSQRRTKMFLVLVMFQAANNAHKRNAASTCYLTYAFGTPPPLSTRPTQQFFPPTAKTKAARCCGVFGGVMRGGVNVDKRYASFGNCLSVTKPACQLPDFVALF
jgi:hypothetical protein